jgi:hypothetical protein
MPPALDRRQRRPTCSASGGTTLASQHAPNPSLVHDGDADGEIRLVQPSSRSARLILAVAAGFAIAGLLTWTPVDLPTPAWRAAYLAVVALLLLVFVILPLYAALTGADAVWRLRPGRLGIDLHGPLRRRHIDVTGDNIATVAVDLVPARGGPDRIVVRLERRDAAPLVSPPFDDPLEAEWFADALAAALGVAAPANLLPPGLQPARPWLPRAGRLSRPLPPQT